MNWELLINFRWPHQGFSLGYDLVPADEDEPYHSVLFYLGCFTIIFNFE